MMNIRFLTYSFLSLAAIVGNAENCAILSEDFSLFSKGSEENPSTEMVSAANRLPVELTHGLQWFGNGAHEAGGVCALRHYIDDKGIETPGWIGTPFTDVRLDDGKFKVRFRARSTSDSGDELILYLQDQWTSNYYTVEHLELTPDWKQYEIALQHNWFGNRVAYVQLGAVDFDWFIDDFEIVQDVYDISSPHGLPPCNVDFNKFTARWDAVWSADSYLVSTFYYKNDKPGGERVYLSEEMPAVDTSLEVTGTERGHDYYYVVKAKNERYTSVESDPVRVYVPIQYMAAPELIEPDAVTEDGYLARWQPVDRAMGYALRHFKRFTATENVDYELVHEDLSAVTEGSTAYPAYFYDDNLDKYSKMPGWKVNMGWMANGMIAIDNYYKRFEPGMITSPAMDLSRRDGQFTVTLRVYTKHKDDVVYVDSYQGDNVEHHEFVMTQKGYNDFSVDFTNGGASTIFTITFSGDDKLFIDDIYVIQRLLEGETCITNENSFEIEGADVTSYEFTGLDNSANVEYMYSVAAWSWSLDEEGIWGPTIYSDYSEPVVVKLPNASASVDEPGQLLVITISVISPSEIIVNSPVDAEMVVYNLNGVIIARHFLNRGNNLITIPANGPHIITVGRQAFKVKL